MTNVLLSEYCVIAAPFPFTAEPLLISLVLPLPSNPSGRYCQRNCAARISQVLPSQCLMHHVCRPRPRAPARAAVRRGSCIDLQSAFQSPDRPGTPVALKFPIPEVPERNGDDCPGSGGPALGPILRWAPEVAKERTSALSTGPTAAPGSNRRLQQTQNQVDEVVDIMRVNVDKVLERDQKLSELDDRADALQAGASQFETSAAKLKRKYWWKNCKMWAIGITVLVIFIIIIIVWVVSS
ncbi:PREDICTED: vesicle-associated membrane protein 3 [Mandrillus leucophaeus]|nr:PREDICTED: vesicle-associated membrane protein 3 [Mandrillus leucophaeus]